MLINTASDKVATDLLTEYEISEDTVENQRYSQVISKLGDISISSFRELWKKVELLQFFSSWVSIYKVKPQKITFANFKKYFKGTAFKSSTHFHLDLSPNKSKYIYQFTQLSAPFKSMVDKAGSGNNYRDSMYWLPEEGLLFLKIHKDQSGDKLRTYIETEITGTIEQFRIRSMIISKFYEKTKIIHLLNVSAIFEITGFAGFKQISFEGDHVKQGLYGLHKRQDIRVNLDQIGPNIRASSENLQLKIGPEVMITNFAGFQELLDLM
ncbi:MAG: hypothetical protein GPJ54_00755 [Candidatus Heimdallarchaeota archaeon]|nr:hypothetical protein [Candidatus Heimdallarchaeota archaeon]